MPAGLALRSGRGPGAARQQQSLRMARAPPASRELSGHTELPVLSGPWGRGLSAHSRPRLPSPGGPSQVLTFSKGCLRPRFKDSRRSWVLTSDTSSFVVRCGQTEHHARARGLQRPAGQSQSAQDRRPCTAPSGCDSGHAYLCLTPEHPLPIEQRLDPLSWLVNSRCLALPASSESTPTLPCCVSLTSGPLHRLCPLAGQLSFRVPGSAVGQAVHVLGIVSLWKHTCSAVASPARSCQPDPRESEAGIWRRGASTASAPPRAPPPSTHSGGAIRGAGPGPPRWLESNLRRPLTAPGFLGCSSGLGTTRSSRAPEASGAEQGVSSSLWPRPVPG